MVARTRLNVTIYVLVHYLTYVRKRLFMYETNMLVLEMKLNLVPVGPF